MIGAIIGDIIGSPYEGRRMKFFDYDFDLFNEKSTFTDDTILTIATAKAILSNKPYKDAYLDLGKKYLRKGYGASFHEWLCSKDPQPYNSWGNGAAMRISPVAFYMNGQKNKYDIYSEEVEKSVSVTHNHPYAISSSQAYVEAILMALDGESKEDIKQRMIDKFQLIFDNDWQHYRDNYRFDVTCKGTVIQSMTAFFESVSFEDCIRKSILMGGDTDTLACISGSLAEAYYKYIPKEIEEEALLRIPVDFLDVIKEFYERVS